MTKTPEESRQYQIGYGRGYTAGRKGFWPDHRPPTPPGYVTGALVRALRRLRDAVDSTLATFDPEDEIVTELGPLMDEATEALQKVTESIVPSIG